MRLNNDDIRELVLDMFGNDLSRSYPTPLPPALAPWYVYHRDAGHGIVVAAKSLYDSRITPDRYLVPASVKTVIRLGWDVTPEGLVVCDVEYHPVKGVVCPSEEYQY